MESEFETAIQQYVDLGFPSVLLTLSKKKHSKDTELRTAVLYISYFCVDDVNLFILF